jgi:hypothetical protein
MIVLELAALLSLMALVALAVSLIACGLSSLASQVRRSWRPSDSPTYRKTGGLGFEQEFRAYAASRSDWKQYSGD